MKIQTALADLIDKLDGWVHGLLLLLPNMVLAIVVVVVFWFLAKLVDRLLRKLLTRVGVGHEVIDLTLIIVFIAVTMTGLFIALDVLGLDKAVTSLLAGVGILGIALGLAFQSTGENYVAGVYLSVSRPFQIGHIIKCLGYYGTVERITLRSTWLRVPDGQLVYLPNKKVFDEAIVNYSDSGKRRVDIKAHVAYTGDLEKVRRIAIEAVSAMENRDPEREVELFYREFKDSWIEFELRFWIDFPSQVGYLSARSDAMMRIMAAFDAHGIGMPFPKRTLDFV